MRFSPFDFDVATSPEEQEAAALRFREPLPPKPATSPQGPAPTGSGATRLRGDDTAEHDHSAR